MISPTKLPVTGTTPPPPAVVLTSTQPPIGGYDEDEASLANYPAVFDITSAPVVTLSPASKRRSLSALEILLIATAVAVGVITLCLLLSVSKSR